MAPKQPLIEIAIQTLKDEVALLEKKKKKIIITCSADTDKRKKISGQLMILRKMLRKLIKL